MPIIQSTFHGSKLFHDAHLETILPAIFRKLTVNYSRERIETPDGDFFDVDRINNGSRKLMILLHGLEGSSASTYIKGFATYFYSRGWDIAAKNFRSCSGEINRLPISYHSGFTTDLRQLLEQETIKAGYDTIVLVGFSLGGNVLLKYLGEQGMQTSPKLKAAVAFSVPVDLESSSIELAKWHNRLYLKRFLKTLKQKAIVKSNLFHPFPDVSMLKDATDFQLFDDMITAPLHGFAGASDYYSKSSSLTFLPFIQIPTLLVNATNDPFLAAPCFPFDIARSSTMLHFEAPTGGGHVGFAFHLPNASFWSEVRTAEFLEKVL
jgi:predicted alpha/beta-fold hydrolase